MKRLNLFLIILVGALILLTNQQTSAKSNRHQDLSDTIRILTIGNSFADNACLFLQRITESVEGCNIIIGKANIGGCFLEKHANLIQQCELDSMLKPYSGKSLKEILQQDYWNVVTIQQVSYLSFKAETYQPYANEICDFVNKYASQAKIFIHETWAYAPDCSRLEEFGMTSGQMYRRLKKNYNILSRNNSLPILPSGDAFHRSSRKNKEINLWSIKDRYHASINGCYLAGCVWFGKLFGRSPNEITYIPKGMKKETAKFLQTIASR
ncbi:DUF4886 domain-containing protein [Sunxiuqinia sp. A32]|uniref:DUF4886 domain-containing protein n=1 Tax=Sunxiuqinia sp. A32 TaxID=3461496 RepID=UPI0040463EBE